MVNSESIRTWLRINAVDLKILCKTRNQTGKYNAPVENAKNKRKKVYF